MFGSGALLVGRKSIDKMATRAVLGFNVEVALKGLFAKAMTTAFPAVPAPEPLVTPGKFSDFQCNNAMGMAKLLSTQQPPVKLPPKAIGQQLVAALPQNDLVESAEVTEQGFITIKVNATWLGAALNDLFKSGVVPPPLPKEKVLVDFSSPNIAKEMHVGHLRSTIIGECLCRLLEFVGHDVKRINHVGDWGTQFGMLILYMKINFPNFLEVPPPISDLVVFYKAAKKKFDEDPEFKENARNEVVKLQALEENSIKAWKMICDLSRKDFQQIYDRLHITLEERGESFYNPIIPQTLQMLRDANQIEVSDGAEIIFSKEEKPLSALDAKDLARVLSYFVSSKRDGSIEFNAALEAELAAIKAIETKEDGSKVIAFTPKEVKPLLKFDTMKEMDKLAKLALPLFKPKAKPALDAELAKLGLKKGDNILVPRFSIPLMARKSDGGYTYDTTDLAAAYHRFVTEKYERVVYVTDSGQFEHFKMVLQTAADMGWIGSGRWSHAGFGLVSGEDGKKLKTRSGETEKLRDLLDEAVDRAYVILETREKEANTSQGFTEAEMRELARKIGFGAIKYFDLKQNRTTDYSFSYDKMLDFAGNTAVFLLYSYARISSIKRKASVNMEAVTETIQLPTEKERQLALAVLKFEPTILKTVDDLYPHHITDFCYELVGSFSDFYGECRVVGDPMQNSRLLLLEVVAQTLQKALELLGIEVADRL
jgi:arginyl-tRNA synthetase